MTDHPTTPDAPVIIDWGEGAEPFTPPDPDAPSCTVPVDGAVTWPGPYVQPA